MGSPVICAYVRTAPSRMAGPARNRLIGPPSEVLTGILIPEPQGSGARYPAIELPRATFEELVKTMEARIRENPERFQDWERLHVKTGTNSERCSKSTKTMIRDFRGGLSTPETPIGNLGRLCVKRKKRSLILPPLPPGITAEDIKTCVGPSEQACIESPPRKYFKNLLAEFFSNLLIMAKRFEPHRRILRILVGSNLYGSAHACVRELLQKRMGRYTTEESECRWPRGANYRSIQRV